MRSLYLRLFTYRESEHRSPLENFLTEALADLLGRVPVGVAKGLIARLLGDTTCSFEATWPDHARMRWVTQYGVGDGRSVDLVLLVDDVPFLAIESKIGAGLQQHRVQTASGETEWQDQLATYGQWVASAADPAWGGALILLTHWTPPPRGFREDGVVYGSSRRAVVRWSTLTSWLDELSRSPRKDAPVWHPLAAELVKFLKEMNLDSELATSRDLAALQIYVGSADRIRHTIERIWTGSKDLWYPLCTNSDKWLEVTSEYGCVWKWRWLNRPGLRESYLAVGVRFPGTADHLAAAAPDDAPYLFVELATESDSDHPSIKRLSVPATWWRRDGALLAARSMKELPGGGEELAAEGERWVRERITEAAKALDQS